MNAPKFRWAGNHIEIDPPKRCKKLTGTRFAAVQGLNKWSTPFEIWCAVTRTYEKPFEDTIYTGAGKAIEPKQAEYMKRAYAMYDLTTPEDVFGKDYFKKTYGDFFRDANVVGGMWDFLLMDENKKPYAVLEMKTTKRAEDWAQDVPEYYAQQAALYAYLLGVDQVYMVGTVLDEKDYDNPEAFVVSGENTFVVPFKVSERYPNFSEIVQSVLDWWDKYVVTGISPDYDEKADADVLKALRTNHAEDSEDLTALMADAIALNAYLESAKETIAEKEKQYKQVTDAIKQILSSQLRDGDKQITASVGDSTFTLTKKASKRIDESALEADGLLEKYKTKDQISYTLTLKNS